MRRLMLGVLLAAGAALPTIAAAQDHPPEPGHQHEHGGEHPHDRGDGGGRPAQQPRPAPQQAAPAQPRPQAQPPRPQPPARPQGQIQPQAQARFDGRGDGGRFRGDGDARFNGGDPRYGGRQPQGFRADAGQQGRTVDGNPDPAARSQPFRRDDGQPPRGYNGDPNRGAQPGYRGPQGGPGGYPPQGYDRGPGPQYHGEAGRGRPGGGPWDRGWRGDNHYDWGRYRAQNRYAFHLPRYYAPPGWRYGYRRFSVGFTLSAELFDRGFWIDDAYAYRLPPAQWPYQWVRYYNDALLVDVRTGYVVDTVYDIFW